MKVIARRGVEKQKDIELKALKLLIAALLTALLCLAVVFLLDRDGLYVRYRCWTQAVNLSSCFGDQAVDFVADIDGLRYEGNTGNEIDHFIFFFGAFEKPILYFFRDAMASAYANQGVFLDIGANTGQYSLFMSRYSKEVHAFEPWEPVRKRFSRMVEINHINNIVIHAVGLSDESAKKPFFRPPENNLGSGSFLDGFRDDNRFEGDVLELQIGDEALKKAGVSSVAMIKMDIEGYEKLALKGLRGTLQKNRPIVMFEMTVNPQVPVSIKSHAEIAGLFPENYEFLAFTQPDDKYTGAYTLKPSEAVVRFDKYKIYNIVAYPIEKRAHFSRQRPG